MTTKQTNNMSYNPFSLAGKRILVTGASSGIGKETAIDCSKMGASVVISGRNENRLLETLKNLDTECGQCHKCIVADLSIAGDIDQLVVEVGDLDGVVLCSGKGLMSPFLFASRDKFNDVFDTNFFSPVEVLRILAKKKKLRSKCSVIFVVSIGGTSEYSVGGSIYGASKAALQSMIHYCAQELAPKGIRVNGINPGMVNTPLIRTGTLTQEQIEKDVQNYPLKRYGEPEDIAHGIIYLLSDASSWITGQSLVIDGGLTCK